MCPLLQTGRTSKSISIISMLTNLLQGWGSGVRVGIEPTTKAYQTSAPAAFIITIIMPVLRTGFQLPTPFRRISGEMSKYHLQCRNFDDHILDKGISVTAIVLPLVVYVELTEYIRWQLFSCKYKHKI